MFQLALVGYSKILFIYSRGFLFASVHATILIYFAISFRQPHYLFVDHRSLVYTAAKTDTYRHSSYWYK